MSQRYTHTLQIFPAKTEQEIVAPGQVRTHELPPRYVLSRWDNGLVLGMAQGIQMQVIDFEKDRSVATSYRDEKYSLMALRKYADKDAVNEYGEPHAFIEEIDMDKKVLKPNLTDIAQVNRVK